MFYRHENVLTVAAGEQDMKIVLRQIADKLAACEATGFSLARLDNLTTSEELACAIAPTLTVWWDVVFPGGSGTSPKGRSYGAPAEITYSFERSYALLGLRYQTLWEPNMSGIDAFFAELPEGTYGAALFDADEAEDFETIMACSKLLHGGKPLGAVASRKRPTCVPRSGMMGGMAERHRSACKANLSQIASLKTAAVTFGHRLWSGWGTYFDLGTYFDYDPETKPDYREIQRVKKEFERGWRYLLKPSKASLAAAQARLANLITRFPLQLELVPFHSMRRNGATVALDGQVVRITSRWTSLPGNPEDGENQLGDWGPVTLVAADASGNPIGMVSIPSRVAWTQGVDALEALGADLACLLPYIVATASGSQSSVRLELACENTDTLPAKAVQVLEDEIDSRSRTSLMPDADGVSPDMEGTVVDFSAGAVPCRQEGASLSILNPMSVWTGDNPPWTTQELKRFFSLIRRGDVEGMRAFAKKTGYKALAPLEARSRNFMQFENGDTALDIWGALVVSHSADMLAIVCDEFGFALDEASYARWLTPEGLESRKAKFTGLRSQRPYIFDFMRPWDNWHWNYSELNISTLSCKENEERWFGFLDALIERGYSRGDLKFRVSGIDTLIFEFLPENIDLLDKMLAAGLGVIYPPRADDELAGDFLVDLLVNGRKLTAERLIDAYPQFKNKGYEATSQHGKRPFSTDDLTFLASFGLHPVRVNVGYADRDAILGAIAAGARPVVDTRRGRDMDEQAERAMSVLSRRLDFELIEQALAQGFTRGVDVGAAWSAKRSDLLELYARHGIDVTFTTVLSGESVTDKHGMVTIPEGITSIEDGAFDNMFSLTEVKPLPTSLTKIGKNHFRFAPSAKPECMSIEVPPTVTEMTAGSLQGFTRITVFDTVDPEARSAYEGVDSEGGRLNGIAGSLGASISVDIFGKTNIGGEYEVIVRSAQSRAIKHRVWMPLSSKDGEVLRTFMTVWGRSADVAFTCIDDLFEKLPNKESKVKTAVNRLSYPIDLSEDARTTYVAYLKRFGKDAARYALDEKDETSVRALIGAGLIAKRNKKELAAYAQELGSEDLAEMIEAAN